MLMQTLNGYIIKLLAEPYKKVSLGNPGGTGFFLGKSTKGLKYALGSCSFFGIYNTKEIQK